MKAKLPSEEIIRLLKSVYDDCIQEDQSVRERQIREWRELKLLWEGFSQIWFDDVAHDWRIWDAQDIDSDQDFYDKPINVLRAYLESIIAALSITVPPVTCFPDDADNTLDLATAKAGDKIAQLIYRHNNIPILWLHALFIFVTEGLTAVYGYPKKSKKYGTYEDKQTDEVNEDHEITSCSNCGHPLNDRIVATNGLPQNTEVPIEPPVSPIPPQPDLSSQQVPPQMPPDMGAPPQQMQPSISPDMQGMPPVQPIPLDYTDEFMPDGQELCPACMQMMNPEIKQETSVITRLIGVTKEPKTRICLEAYGGLHIKIPNYCKRQEDLPYLIFSYESDYTMAVDPYDHLHGNKELKEKVKSGNQGSTFNEYEQWGRLSLQYREEYPINVVTTNKIWIRPQKFNILQPEDAKKLRKQFPDGVNVTFVDDNFAEAKNADLDDYWTLLENPLSDFLHFNPAGKGLKSVQEITSDWISLILQTIEHGIGQTFADPQVLSFKNYKKTEVTPGGIFPAKPKSGATLKDGFFEMNTATLSPEVMPFNDRIQSLAQISSGALPSIFGGQIEGSETASEYSMSRAQAQQRLQNSWKMFTTLWKSLFGKVIPMYIKETKAQDEERDVQKQRNGNFVNVLIRKADLEGKIGKVELEANENLPMTWAQTKDMVEKLMLNANPKIQEILSAPENLPLIHDALGLVDFYVPGEDDTIKQNDEIKQLLDSEPIPTGDPMMPEQPSVQVDPDFDNHAIEFEVCRKWIISEIGRQTKTDNEPGYRNVLLHAKAHLQIMQMQQMQQAMQQQGEQGKGATPNAKPNPKTQEAPITGESNVNQVH
jgi:hypothetical protein